MSYEPLYRDGRFTGVRSLVTMAETAIGSARWAEFLEWYESQEAAPFTFDDIAPPPKPKTPAMVWAEVQAMTATKQLLFARRCVSKWFGVPLSIVTEAPDVANLKDRLRSLLLSDREAFQTLVRYAANLPNWSVYQD